MVLFKYILIVLFLNALSFFMTAGIVKLLSWAFSFAFSWKLSVGIWVVIWILGLIFKKR